MPIGRRGLIVPQNTFLEDVIRRSDGLHGSFMVGSAEISDYPVVYCNSGFAKVTGFKRSEVMKSSCDGRFLLGTSTARKDVLGRIQGALRQKTACQEEFIGRKRDGTPVWYLFNVAAVENEENVVVLFLVTVRDISEFKEPICENEGSAVQKWVKLKKSLKKERSAFVVAFSKTKEEKNKIRIAQLMFQNSEFIPQYKQQIPRPPKWVILHYSFPKVTWDWFVLFFILYTASAVPFVFCFNYESLTMIIIDSLVDIFFFVDIVLTFHTSYVGVDGEVITELKQIRQHYFRTWFLPDLVTSLPYSLISVVGSSNTVFVNLISFFKCIRLLRVSRVIRKLDYFINYGFITLMLCLVVFLLCAHLMACLFYLIARTYDDFHEVGWVATMAKQTNQPFNTSTTDTVLPTLASLYVSSLYYCLTSLTTIGFGNISPNTTAEKMFGCVTMIVGALGYAVIFGQVTAIVQQAQKQSEKYHALLENIKSFQRLYKVPVELSARILDYFMSTWALTKGVDTDEVLKQCPKDLQSDICIHLNRKVLYNNSAFSSMPMSVMRTIARNFCICHVAPGDRVVHEGESLDVLYFISHGSFEVKQDGCVVGLLGQGDVFGDDICNEVTVGKSIADVHALTYSDIHCIDRNDVREVLMSYPEFGVEFSRNLKLSFNLRNQVTKKDSSTASFTYSHQEALVVENKQSSFQLPHRTSRVMNPACRGRRLSLVQELNQTIDLESSFTLDPNSISHFNPENPAASVPTKGNIKRQKERTSSDVIFEEKEIDLLPESFGDPDIQGSEIREEAGLLFIDQNKSTIDDSVSQLRAELREDVEKLNSKLIHIESQLCLLLRLVHSGGKSLTPNTGNSTSSQSPMSETQNQRSPSATNLLASPEEASSSTRWLSPKPSPSDQVASADKSRKTSTPRHNDEDDDNKSPQVITRFGRRKVGYSETK